VVAPAAADSGAAQAGRWHAGHTGLWHVDRAGLWHVDRAGLWHVGRPGLWRVDRVRLGHSDRVRLWGLEGGVLARHGAKDVSRRRLTGKGAARSAEEVRFASPRDYDVGRVWR
jgi:hypothetical protein